MFLSTAISHRIWISSRFIHDSMHMSMRTFGPCPGTSSLPPQTCWSKQLPQLVSWLHSVGCSVSSQIQCPGSLYSAQTPVQPSSDPASAVLLLPTDAWKCMNRYNWLNFQPSKTEGLKLHTEDLKSRIWDYMTHSTWYIISDEIICLEYLYHIWSQQRVNSILNLDINKMTLIIFQLHIAKSVWMMAPRTVLENWATKSGQGGWSDSVRDLFMRSWKAKKTFDLWHVGMLRMRKIKQQSLWALTLVLKQTHTQTERADTALVFFTPYSCRITPPVPVSQH